MEEKERYELVEEDFAYAIVDNEKHKTYQNDCFDFSNICDLLNRQDKENQKLCQQIVNLNKENNKLREFKDDILRVQAEPYRFYKKIQQLHDLPKKIVEEVEKNFTEYLPLKYKTGAGFYSRLNAILKKYGGENE